MRQEDFDDLEFEEKERLVVGWKANKSIFVLGVCFFVLFSLFVFQNFLDTYALIFCGISVVCILLADRWKKWQWIFYFFIAFAIFFSRISEKTPFNYIEIAMIVALAGVTLMGISAMFNLQKFNIYEKKEESSDYE